MVIDYNLYIQYIIICWYDFICRKVLKMSGGFNSLTHYVDGYLSTNQPMVILQD